MNYITYGKRENKSLLFIHGLASTAALCFEPLLPYLQDYYVILCELDGHCGVKPDDVFSMKRSIDDIENYIKTELDGEIYGLCVFSIGGTIAVELLGRGNVSVQRAMLDAPITIDMGPMAWLYALAFTVGTGRIRKGKRIPKCLLDSVMGKDNNSVIEMMYPNITKKTIKNAFKYLHHYMIPRNLSDFSKPVLLLRGSLEPLPSKSEEKLREYLPQMSVEVFEGMGHGQFLHERPEEYAKKLRAFLL